DLTKAGQPFEPCHSTTPSDVDRERPVKVKSGGQQTIAEPTSVRSTVSNQALHDRQSFRHMGQQPLLFLRCLNVSAAILGTIETQRLTGKQCNRLGLY